MWRVRDRATFEALAGARRHRDGVVTLRAVAGDPSLPPRVSFAVGRRAGNAVMRNRIRRRLRAAILESQHLLMAGSAYLFTAGAPAATASFDGLVGSVRRVLARAGNHAE